MNDTFLPRCRAAAEALYGPLNQTHGVASEALDEAEARLGFALPATLRSFYALAGELTPVNVAFNRILAPSELRLTKDGALVFCVEHQDVVSWGILAKALLKGDPPVFQCDDEQEPTWYEDSASLSGFLLKQLFVQSAEALPTIHAGSMDSDTVAAMRDEWSPAVDDVDGIFFLKPGVLVTLAEREEVAIAGGESVTRRWADACVYEGYQFEAASGWRSTAPHRFLEWLDSPATEAGVEERPDPEFFEFVPRLVGLDEADARRTVEQIGFFLGVSSEGKADPKAPKGTVLRQEPAAGEQLLTGQAVEVVCSLGPDEVFLPSLTGKTAAEAQSYLELLGFRLGEVRGTPPAGCEPVVIASDPTGGAMVPRGAEIHVTLRG